MFNLFQSDFHHTFSNLPHILYEKHIIKYQLYYRTVTKLYNFKDS